MDGVLLQQAEWLLRDVLLIEELLPQPDDEIQILTQAVSGVLVNVQGLLDAAHYAQLCSSSFQGLSWDDQAYKLRYLHILSPLVISYS